MGSLDSAPRGPASALFTPLTIANGKTTLNHRIIMAPMTRNRCILLPQESESSLKVWVADELVAKYYSQRATDGGLIITESILPSPEAGGMPGVPGLWCDEQVKGWEIVRPSIHFPAPLINNYDLGDRGSPRQRRHNLRSNNPPRPHIHPRNQQRLPHRLVLRNTLVDGRKIPLPSSGRRLVRPRNV